jgi:hypothetical protein
VGAFGISLTSEAGFVEGNFLGSPDGVTGAGNAYGVFDNGGPGSGSTAAGSVIGGTTPQSRNIVVNNNEAGIFITPSAVETTVEGNFIGVDATGQSCVANGISGITGLYSSNTIGGTLAGARNVITCNSNNMDINDKYDSGHATGGLLQGNYLGVDVTGTKGLSSSGDGVRLQ